MIDESADSDEQPSKRDAGAGDEPWRRRRRVDSVFGEDLPHTTKDDRDEGHRGISRDWYESNRPPHYE